jgi:hypothetical protein
MVMGIKVSDMEKISLFKNKNDKSDYVDASITKEGDLRVVRNSFGPGDFETEVTAAVSKKDKDQLLLALLDRVFSGNKDAVEDFLKFAKSKKIPVQWFRWP